MQKFLYENNSLNINIDKHWLDQQQAEIGAIGINVNSGVISNLYAVNYLFEEAYSIDHTQLDLIIEKMICTAVLILRYFNVRNGNIIFISPKLNNSLLEPLEAITNSLNDVFHSLDLELNFSIHINDQFRDVILQPVCNSLGTNTETASTELFLNSIKLYNAFSSIDTIKEDSSNEDITRISRSGIHYSNGEKIGSLVRRELGRLIEQGKITSEIIDQLTDLNFSKNTFKLNHPMLKIIKESQSIYVQRMVNGYGRYYSQEFKINGKRYLLCNDWYEKSRSKFLDWVELRDN